MKESSLFTVLLIYSVFALTTFFYWDANGKYSVTGDEPHYLVMASGIIKNGTLEQTVPYTEESKARLIYKGDLGMGHTAIWKNGRFNVHNIGLPLLLSIPFMLGGIVGAKLLMVLFGALIIVVAWKFSSHFSDNNTYRFWAIVAATISLPLIPGSNQIYPDLLAGLIALTGLYWFFTVHERRSAVLEALLAVTIAFLPWIQIKFAATCLVLLFSVSAKIYLQSKDLRTVFRILLIGYASFVMLIVYNVYAFGNIYGPYSSGALQFSKTSLMVLLGLHFDQNQGFILQNPVNLIGIIAIGWMYKFKRIFACVWLLVFLSLIVPNALHPNWYGGWSFSGRFQWAAAVVFSIPTIYGLIVIAKSKEKLFRFIVASGAILQLYFFHVYAVGGVNLYNKPSNTWNDNYSIFYPLLDKWMPSLYNSSWAYEYWPNYSWMILVGVLLFVGFLNKERIAKRLPFILTTLLIVIFISGYTSNIVTNTITFKAQDLPYKTGNLVGYNRVAKQNLDSPGYVNFGPYFALRKGSYAVVLSYKSSAGASQVIGHYDVYNATARKQLSNIPLHGTDGAIKRITADFELAQRGSDALEFRTYWNGNVDIEVQGIELRKN